MSKPKRESLDKLRTLVETLSDRDVGLKRDVSLFEAAFKDFPVPVAIWLSDENGLCVTRRISDSGLRGLTKSPPPKENEITDVLSMYQCPVLRSDVERGFKSALKGAQVSFLSSVEDVHIWTRLTPSYHEDGSCSGVIGVSWELTEIFKMFSALTRISDTVGCVGDLAIEEMKTAAREAVQGNFIRSLMIEAA